MVPVDGETSENFRCEQEALPLSGQRPRCHDSEHLGRDYYQVARNIYVTSCIYHLRNEYRMCHRQPTKSSGPSARDR